MSQPITRTPRYVDVLLEVLDSRLRVLEPQSSAARLWLELQVPRGQWLGGGLLCTPAEAAVLVPALEAAGFTVGPGDAGDVTRWSGVNGQRRGVDEDRR